MNDAAGVEEREVKHTSTAYCIMNLDKAGDRRCELQDRTNIPALRIARRPTL